MKFNYEKFLQEIPVEITLELTPKPTETAVISIGKASFYMFEKLLDKYPKLKTSETIIIHPDSVKNTKNYPFAVSSTHPFITEKSFQAGEKLVDFVKQNNGKTFITLLSGGSSALIEYGKKKETIIATAHKLFYSGKDIVEINRKRIEISDIKGGKLCRFAPSSHWHTIVMNDIPFEKGYLLVGSMPTYNPENPKTTIKIAAESNTVNRKLAELLRKQNYDIKENIQNYHGTVQNLSKILNSKLSQMKKGEAVIVTGESTIKIPKEKGYGGRLTHLALQIFSKIPAEATFYALSTDGRDGLSQSAGVIITKESLTAMQNDSEAEKYLKTYNSALFFRKHNALQSEIETGLNLNDMIFAVRD